MTARLPCAVLGASGYIGQHFVRLLADHPWFELDHVTASGRTVGHPLGDGWLLPDPVPAAFARRRVRPTSPAELARRGVRVVFSALPGEVAGDVETACRRRGLAVFSNASSHRRSPGVPLLVPEVNPGHLAVLGRRRSVPPLVTNPNCTTTGLAVAMAPIRELLTPRTVHVATYQALSGAGVPGVPSLAAVDNVVPFIAGEEEKVAAELPWIFGRPRRTGVRPDPMRVLASCVRVPVRDGHLEAVTIEAARRPALADLVGAWSRFDPLASLDLPTAPHPPILLRTEPDRPQPIRDRWSGTPPAARGMAVVVGRVRWTPPYLRFFVLSHNAIRGGAGGSVLNAELAARQGYLGRDVPGGTG